MNSLILSVWNAEGNYQKKPIAAILLQIFCSSEELRRLKKYRLFFIPPFICFMTLFSVTFCIPVGNVIFQPGGRIFVFQIFVKQCDSRCAVYVVIAVYHYFFVCCDSLVKAFNSFVHILHQKRVMPLTTGFP